VQAGAQLDRSHVFGNKHEPPTPISPPLEQPARLAASGKLSKNYLFGKRASLELLT